MGGKKAERTRVWKKGKDQRRGKERENGAKLTTELHYVIPEP